jgi:hypothetical protein
MAAALLEKPASNSQGKMQHNRGNTENGTRSEETRRSKDTCTKEKPAPECITGIKGSSSEGKKACLLSAR